MVLLVVSRYKGDGMKFNVVKSKKTGKYCGEMVDCEGSTFFRDDCELEDLENMFVRSTNDTYRVEHLTQPFPHTLIIFDHTHEQNFGDDDWDSIMIYDYKPNEFEIVAIEVTV
jgi:hypothetical protein